jgi:polyphosphate glucokinase
MRCPKVLVVDIGGTHVKMYSSEHRTRVRIDSGPWMTPARMVNDIRHAVDGWQYDVVSLGYPGPVMRGKPLREPAHLGRGWVRFDFRKGFGRPVRIVNDAAMQALGSYRGGRMLFLGLGTGLGTAMIVDDTLLAMELAHLPYKNGDSFEDRVGAAGLSKKGLRKWRKAVADVIARLRDAVQADYVVVGGGNAKRLKSLPPRARVGHNRRARDGGIRLWRA